MRQSSKPKEHFRRGNALLILIAALQSATLRSLNCLPQLRRRPWAIRARCSVTAPELNRVYGFSLDFWLGAS
jgi:hypothetical protein